MAMKTSYSPYFNKHLKYAIPFLIFVVGGSVGLQQFTSLRYKYRAATHYDPKEEIKKAGITMTDPKKLSLEAQYEEMKKVDISNWENVRIPRPE